MEHISLKSAELANLLKEETKGLEAMDILEIMDTRPIRGLETSGELQEREM